MKTRAAILWGLNQPWEIEEVELDGPKRDEVTVKLVACGHRVGPRGPVQ